MQQTKSDEVLMQEYRDGQVEAFAMLYNRKKSEIYRYFLRQTNHSASSEELAQDVWAKVINAKDRYTNKAKFSTYLYKIAHNRLIDHHRRKTIRPLDNLSDANEGETTDFVEIESSQPDKQLEAAQRLQTLKTLILSLPYEQREAFILKQEAGLDNKDIAAITGVDKETVKSRLRYAHTKLKTGLESQQ